MRVLFFIDSLRAGGKERRLVELLTYLAGRPEYSIRLVVSEADIHYLSVLELGITIDVLRRRRGFSGSDAALRFAGIVREFRPDIIHAWGPMASVLALPAKWLFRRPLVSNLIADTWGTKGRSVRVQMSVRLSTRFADLILSNSHAGLRAYGLEPGPRVAVIHNGINLSRFDFAVDPAEVRREIGVRSRFLVIMVASAHVWKGYDLLLDVARSIQGVRSDVTFVGVGGGQELKRLEQRVVDEGIKNIILCGPRGDVERLVSASDVGVLLSDSEGVSNAVLEYMALGKPVVSTDLNGGTGEVIEQGRSGYMVPSDVGRIVSAIVSLIDSPVDAKRMGERGRQLIELGFTIDRMGARFERAYREALGRI